MLAVAIFRLLPLKFDGVNSWNPREPAPSCFLFHRKVREKKDIEKEIKQHINVTMVTCGGIRPVSVFVPVRSRVKSLLSV